MFKQWLKYWFSKKAEQEAILIVDLGKEDVLVIHCKHPLSADMVEKMHSQLKQVTNGTTQVLVLPMDITYSVIHRKD